MLKHIQSKFDLSTDESDNIKLVDEIIVFGSFIVGIIGTILFVIFMSLYLHKLDNNADLKNVTFNYILNNTEYEKTCYLRDADNCNCGLINYKDYVTGNKYNFDDTICNKYFEFIQYKISNLNNDRMFIFLVVSFAIACIPVTVYFCILFFILLIFFWSILYIYLLLTKKKKTTERETV